MQARTGRSFAAFSSAPDGSRRGAKGQIGERRRSSGPARVSQFNPFAPAPLALGRLSDLSSRPLAPLFAATQAACQGPCSSVVGGDPPHSSARGPSLRRAVRGRMESTETAKEGKFKTFSLGTATT
ncbi:hypothetical protein BGZ61DRAFT_48833 [Ilyonectria robusta]|uniref:uncharacterized protein n=1 Tax=Ilyonectria robusta TaxID=1079257 RepID=UPI001E8E0A66|nr:uncharacterized protein BGZ61DRAFT_48833 [Ilyonectria robusta]KAH8686959.1 hypothetical protein BGZ61DRAFT_48833 [Ilyonectria robusta]